MDGVELRLPQMETVERSGLTSFAAALLRLILPRSFASTDGVLRGRSGKNARHDERCAGRLACGTMNIDAR